MILFLIRHAQSQNNALPEDQRIEDPGLTELGHRQARCLGEWIPRLQLTRLITSPFLRTLQTTQYIYEATGLTPEIRTPLHEQGGCVAGPEPSTMIGRPGLNRSQLLQNYPDYQLPDDIDERGWWKSQPYETHAQANRRAASLLHATCQEFSGSHERVAFVMHADFKLLLLRQFHVAPLATPRNASVTRIRLQEPPQLEEFNTLPGLPAELVTQ